MKKDLKLTLDQKAALMPKIPIMSFDEIEAVYNTKRKYKK